MTERRHGQLSECAKHHRNRPVLLAGFSCLLALLLSLPSTAFSQSNEQGWRPKGGTPSSMSEDSAPNSGWRPKSGLKPRAATDIRPAEYTPDNDIFIEPTPRKRLPQRPLAPDPKPVINRVQARQEPELMPELPAPTAVKPLSKTPDARATLIISAARNSVARGLIAEALPGFEEYIRLYPNDREVRREYAGLLVQADRVKNAIEQYRSLLVEEPENTSLLVPLADAYLQIKDFRKASALLSKALETRSGQLGIRDKADAQLRIRR